LALSGQRDSALVYRRHAVQLDPSSSWTWNVLAKAHAFLGARDSAIHAAERAQSVDSADWSSSWVLMNE
jgi:Flp pilus assembly protein TadD